MLEEKLHLLEKKISTLVEELKRARKENTAQRGEVETLGAQAGRVPELEKENDRLNKRVQELEREMASGAAKEERVRERLRGIIEKIDALEEMAEKD